MSIYQCKLCGCAENTALGHYWGVQVEERKCSACKTGVWHDQFPRTFLPKGEFFTNGNGNIEHIDTGLIGNEAHAKYGRDHEYE